MNKLYKLLFLVPIIIIGCKAKDTDYQIITQSIKSMNMNIYTDEGIKSLSIKSPYSNYDKINNTFKLKETTINLFKDNKLEYIIKSNNSKISNNNQLIELNGNVYVTSIIKKEDKLYANSFTWNTKNSSYILVGNVKYNNDTITLTSNKAILNKDNNIIEFFNPVKYTMNDRNNESEFKINSNNAYYNINTKTLSFKSKEERVRSKLYF